MRDAAIVEIGVREVATYCDFAEFAHSKLAEAAEHDTGQTFFFIHAFLANCATVARLIWSEQIAGHANGRTIAALLDLPREYRSHDDNVRALLENYDRHLAQGLAMRGEVGKILDRNVGDRDAFEEEFGVFLRHYDPSVATLTLMEEELDLQRLRTEIADIRQRATTWLSDNATLLERPAEVTIRAASVALVRPRLI